MIQAWLDLFLTRFSNFWFGLAKASLIFPLGSKGFRQKILSWNKNYVFPRGVACGIYTTNSAEACEYVLKDSGARIVVVENQVHLNKFLKCKETCQIDAIIQYTGEVDDSHNGLVISVSSFKILFHFLASNKTLEIFVVYSGMIFLISVYVSQISNLKSE